MKNRRPLPFDFGPAFGFRTPGAKTGAHIPLIFNRIPPKSEQLSSELFSVSRRKPFSVPPSPSPFSATGQIVNATSIFSSSWWGGGGNRINLILLILNLSPVARCERTLSPPLLLPSLQTVTVDFDYRSEVVRVDTAVSVSRPEFLLEGNRITLRECFSIVHQTKTKKNKNKKRTNLTETRVKAK